MYEYQKQSFAPQAATEEEERIKLCVDGIYTQLMGAPADTVNRVLEAVHTRLIDDAAVRKGEAELVLEHKTNELNCLLRFMQRQEPIPQMNSNPTNTPLNF